MECIIKANKKQLENLGISYDITGLKGNITHKFPTGFYGYVPGDFEIHLTPTCEVQG